MKACAYGPAWLAPAKTWDGVSILALGICKSPGTPKSDRLGGVDARPKPGARKADNNNPVIGPENRSHATRNRPKQSIRYTHWYVLYRLAALDTQGPNAPKIAMLLLDL